MICLGLDPGLDGGLALVDSGDMTVRAWDVPVKAEGKRRRLDAEAYLDLLDKIWLSEDSVQRVTVEAVSAMPGQGVSSMFSFGQVFGAQVMGLHAMGWSPHFVRAGTWKLAMGCGANKDSSLVACLDLFGEEHNSLWWGRNMGLRDGRCEAALLALYGSRR